MVGVPRRDRCHTCRKRKIKCDGAKPHCGQCITNSRACLGYPDAITFLNSGMTQPDKKIVAHAYRSPKRSARDVSLAQVGKYSKQSHSRTRQTMHYRPPPPAAAAALSPFCGTRQANYDWKLPPEPSGTWLRFYDGLLGDFLDSCLPTAATTEEVPLCWLRTLMFMDKHIDALPLAMSALAVSWAGHARSSPQLVNQGLQIYSAASSRLREENPEPGQAQFLATVVLLALYELFEFGDERNKGWVCHAAGITSSLRSLRPEGVLDPLGGDVFRFVRTLFMVQSLKNRRKACAASSHWMTLPFVGVQRSSYQQLLDLGLGAGELIEEVDLLDRGEKGTDSRRGSSATQLLDRLRSQLHALKQWQLANKPSSGPKTAVELTSRAECVSRAILMLRDHSHPSQAPSVPVVSYDVLASARMMLLCWAITLTVLTTMLDSAQLRPLLCDQEAQIRVEGHWITSDILTRISLCSHTMWQSYGSLGADWAIRTALIWEERQGESDLVQQHMGLWEQVGSGPDHISTFGSLGTKFPGKRRSQLMDDFQQAAFGNVDILAMPWCLMEDSGSVDQAARSIRI